MKPFIRRFWLPLIFVCLCVLSVYGIASISNGKSDSASGPLSFLWGNDAQCIVEHEHSSRTGYAFVDFFTGDGGYVARTHCMTSQEGDTDWVWVWFLVAFNLLVIGGYLKIFVFWRKAYLQEEPEDRNTKLMDLAWIFMFCAICGYVSSIVLFVWPAYRLLALMLLPLAYFTWKFAANLDEFKLSLSAKRLARQLNESIHREKQELEQQVAVATSDLLIAKEHAEHANRAKTEFLARMSHEIRTPLTAIIGYSEIALDEEADQNTKARSMQTVSQNSVHLLNLINDILDVSQIQTGEIKYEQIPCSINEILSEVIEMMAFKANKKHLGMHTKIAPGLPDTVVTDPTRIKQMVTNLIGNAIKFTTAGDIHIEVEARSLGSASVGQGSEAKEQFEIQISVQDTGIGINKEHLESVFDSFTQERPSTKRVYGGTGLGLTISRQIARDLGGDLEVQSQRGVGSRFTCTFLVTDAEDLQPDETSERPKQPASILNLASHRFLLVEDGMDNRRLVQHHFRRRGLSLETVDDGYLGFEAVMYAKAHSLDYSIIFMDISMPNMDGIECTRRLREAGVTTPIVMLTAHTLQEEQDRCFIAGATAYVNKPIDFPKLFELASSLLNDDHKNNNFAA